MPNVNWVALCVFVLLFGFITWLGFAAARWRKGDLDLLHEWGLGGRRFGTMVTWFLVGGDLYTAYTFIAVPALAFGAGAIAFFAVPYTIVIYPLLFLVFRRLWHVCHKHGYITAADFVRGRFGNRWLALAVNVTGIVATMPYIAYATLALGSAPALFLYPHSLTAILSANSGRAIRRNAAMLPGYSLMLGLLALVGFFVIAARIADLPEYAHGFKQFGNNFAVPALLLHSFPSWFVGIAFAAIGIGALVPAAIMSIAAANLYSRNIHREFINNNPTDKQEAQVAKWASLIVKFGALIFILFVPTQYAIQLQLLGGIWIVQTLPAVMLGAYSRWFNDWALLVGWGAGTLSGTAMAVATKLTPTFPLALGGYTFPGYTAFFTILLNLGVTIALTPVCNAMLARRSSMDETVAADYHL